ncbi:10886_t:CDS:2, partial [Scutellospora calospora]
GNIRKNFAINPEDPTPFFTNDILDILCNLPREERFKPNNILTLGIIPGPNEPSKHQINNYLAPIVDELVDFAFSIDLLTTFEYKKGCKFYVTLILSLNDVPAARKICSYANHTVKCHHCLKCATYDNLSKKSHYGSFENMDE